jgi:hypothetical protein
MNPRVKMRGALAGAVVALTFALGWSLAKVPSLEDQAAKSDAKADQALSSVATISEEVSANKQALADANRRLVALGKAPVPVPPAPSAAPVQPDEFTATEAAAVRAIVADQISRQKVNITQAEITQIAKAASALVPKPADGKTPTAAQLSTYVKVAVASYCLEGRCAPKPGDKGDPAPKVTDEELLRAAQTALAAHCARQPGGTCEGAAGINGTNGTDGADGRSVVDTDCLEDGRWRITYDKPFPDGETVRYSRGPCRVVVVPDPEAKKGN